MSLGPNDVFYRVSTFLGRLGTTWEEATKKLPRNDRRALMVQVRRARRGGLFNPGWRKLFDLVRAQGGSVCGCQRFQEFIEFMKAAAEKQNLTDRQIADGSDVGATTVWRLLNQKVASSNKTTCEVCTALGIELEF